MEIIQRITLLALAAMILLVIFVLSAPANYHDPRYEGDQLIKLYGGPNKLNGFLELVSLHMIGCLILPTKVQGDHHD